MEPFIPAWWCPSGHAQTVWAAAGRWRLKLPGCRRERWDTPDGDFLDVDHLPAGPGQPTLIILHGLESSSRAPQARGFLGVAQRRGWRGLALNFRSCSGEPNRLRRSYHAGETSDLAWVIRRLAGQHPGDPICCVGLSLGGNVLLKYLGEQGEAAPVLAAAAVSAPFDLAASARAFEESALNRVYMRRLVRSLKRKTVAKLARHPELLDRRRLAAVRTVRDFDEAVTAPLNGFSGAEAYWTESSGRRFLDAIRCPTLLINALDDPLVPAEGLPHREVRQNPALAAAFPAAGGHLGFISGGWPGQPVLWAERAVRGFFDVQLAGRDYCARV